MLVQWATPHVKPSIVALTSPGETVGAFLLATLLLGERSSWVERTGVGIVLVGAWWASTPARALVHE